MNAMDSVGKRTLNERLRTALEEEQFRLYYQPQIDHRTGRVVGAEALLRWLDPCDGLLTPGHFLAELESSGLIVHVGEWALRQAARDCQYWRRRGLPRLRLGLNVSPTQISHRIENPRAFDTGALRACCDLYLEINGREVSGAPHEIIETLHTLQFEGVNIAVQGFGADESLRDRLCGLPVDALKVDGSFVRRMMFDNDAEIAVAGMVALGRAFRLDIVAEGVETLEQLDRLELLGCRQVQGFVYSAPLPATLFEGLLEATTCTPGWASQRAARMAN
jgi:EAL domain-containing protein (putative c-di-GMP-specific phosphodiesterase class I)